jgi:hypothetical protein
MALSSVMTIQNLSNVIQKVIYSDKIEIIQPYGMRDVPRALGIYFLEKRPGIVIEYTAAVIPEIGANEKWAWVANVTGNPFLPKKVYERIVRKNEEKVTELDNPLALPTPLSYYMAQSQIVQQAPKDPNSTECLNLPKKLVRIPPYKRIMVGERTAEWMLRRDQQQLRHHVGKVILCEAPSDFEPNESWHLNDIRDYAVYVDSDVFRNDHPEFGDVLGPDEQSIGLNDQVMLDTKIQLLHKLFFRIVDPAYAKPSEHEFKALREIKKKQQKDKATAAAIHNSKLSKELTI